MRGARGSKGGAPENVHVALDFSSHMFLVLSFFSSSITHHNLNKPFRQVSSNPLDRSTASPQYLLHQDISSNMDQVDDGKAVPEKVPETTCACCWKQAETGLKCPCGTSYCNRECQTQDWKDHKRQHKEKMQRMKEGAEVEEEIVLEAKGGGGEEKEDGDAAPTKKGKSDKQKEKDKLRKKKKKAAAKLEEEGGEPVEKEKPLPNPLKEEESWGGELD